LPHNIGTACTQLPTKFKSGKQRLPSRTIVGW